MFRTFSNFMRVRDIRNKIIFTLLMLIIFRIGTFIPVPGVNAEALNFGSQANAFGVLNIFGDSRTGQRRGDIDDIISDGKRFCSYAQGFRKEFQIGSPEYFL